MIEKVTLQLSGDADFTSEGGPVSYTHLYPASQTGGGISEVGLHPDREICPVFRIPRVLVQAAVDQVTALGEERNASRNLPVEIDPQVGGKGHFDTAATLRPGCCIQLVVGPFTGALQPDCLLYTSMLSPT